MKRRFRIPYLARAAVRTEENCGVEWATKFIEKKSIKFYYGFTRLIADLSLSDIFLITYLSQEMDEHSLVTNSKELKKKFNRTLKRGGSKGLSDTTINRSFKKLRDKRFLIKLKRKRGLYKVNPKFLHHGEEAHRKKSVIKDLEALIKPDALKYRAETYDADAARRKLKLKKDDTNTKDANEEI